MRQKRSTEALKYLAAGARIEPDNACYAYVYGVALNDAGQSTAAIAVLEACIAAHPYDHDALGAAASFLQEAGDPDKALSHAQRLEEVEPDDPPVPQTIKTLNYQLHCNGS